MHHRHHRDTPIVKKLETELHEIEALYARRSDAQEKLREKHRTKFAQLFEAKVQQRKQTAKQVRRSKEKV